MNYKFQNQRKKAVLHSAVLLGALYALIAVVAIGTLGAVGTGDLAVAGMSLCALPMLGATLDLRDSQDDPLNPKGGGDSMTEEEFQRKTLLEIGKVGKTVEDQNGKIENLCKDFDRLDKGTKGDFEKFDKAIKNFNGLSDSVVQLQLAMTKLQGSLRNEQRVAYGSVGRRWVAQDKDRAKALLAEIAMKVRKIEVADGIRKALGEDSTPGSTLITEELIAEVYDALLRYGAWSTLGVRPVGTKAAKIPVKTARGAAAFVLTEGATVSEDSTKAGTSKALEMELIACIVNVSMQLLEDAEVDVVADVIDDIVEAINFRFDYGCFVGDGTADGTHGGITGVFNFGTDVTATATRTTVAATKYTDWLQCLTGIDAAVLMRAARWWMHPTQLARAIAVQDSNGRPIFQSAMEAPASGVGSIFGYPVTLVGAAPSTDTAGSVQQIAAFGDPRAFAVGLRKSITLDESDHAGWNEFERSFRGCMRGDGVGLVATALTVLNTPAS